MDCDHIRRTRPIFNREKRPTHASNWVTEEGVKYSRKGRGWSRGKEVKVMAWCWSESSHKRDDDEVQKRADSAYTFEDKCAFCRPHIMQGHERVKATSVRTR
jgi:hypothetical protein